jgi:hypothetical protein
MNQKEVRRLFDYDAITGCLYWRDSKFKQSHNAVRFDRDRNRIIQVNRRMYVAARLVWTYHHGDELTQLDYLGYVDNNKQNTRIENLYLKDGTSVKSVYRDIRPTVSAERVVYDVAMNYKGKVISKRCRTLTEALEYRNAQRSELGMKFIGMDA